MQMAGIVCGMETRGDHKQLRLLSPGQGAGVDISETSGKQAVILEGKEESEGEDRDCKQRGSSESRPPQSITCIASPWPGILCVNCLIFLKVNWLFVVFFWSFGMLPK